MILLQIKTKKKTAELIASDYALSNISVDGNTLSFRYIDNIYLLANNDTFCKYNSYYIANIGEFKIIRHIPSDEYNNGLITFNPMRNIITGMSDEISEPVTSQFGRLYFGKNSSISIDGECQLIPNIYYNAYNSYNLDTNFGFRTYGNNIGIHINECLGFKLKSFIYNKDYDTFYDYLTHLYGDEKIKIPSSVSYIGENLTPSHTLGGSYDFSLYGVTYSYEYKEVNDPNYVEE